MSIVRVRHDKNKPYVMINRASLWDSDLSLKAVGLWARLLSRPDDWEIHTSELRKSCNCGKDLIWNAMKELIKHGYALRGFVRENATGRYSKIEYIVFESKQSKEDIEELKKSLPHLAFPCTDKPGSEKAPLLSNDLHKRDTKTSSSSVSPTPKVVTDVPYDPTEEEEEEILRKIQERDRKYPKIACLKKWKAEALLNLRVENKAIGTRLKGIAEHKSQAQSFDGKKIRGCRVTCCREAVEFTDGRFYKSVRYDINDAEWKEQTKGFLDD